MCLEFYFFFSDFVFVCFVLFCFLFLFGLGVTWGKIHRYIRSL